MFKCMECNGKTKVLKTIHDVEKVPVENVPDATYNRPIIRREIKCLECGTYFYTKEVFDRFTEETIREKYGKDCVIARSDKPTKIRLDKSILFEGRNLTPVNLDEMMAKVKETFNDDGCVYSKEVEDG